MHQDPAVHHEGGTITAEKVFNAALAADAAGESRRNDKSPLNRVLLNRSFASLFLTAIMLKQGY